MNHESKIETEAAEIIRRAEDRQTRTFLAHGMNPEDIALGKAKYRSFLKRQEEVERQTGKRFFDSPLAHDAFVIGWWTGRQEAADG